MRRVVWISLLCLAFGGACTPLKQATVTPNQTSEPINPNVLKRLPPISAGEPKVKKTFWQHLFPPEDERRAHALPEDDGPHWGELGGG